MSSCLGVEAYHIFFLESWFGWYQSTNVRFLIFKRDLRLCRKGGSLASIVLVSMRPTDHTRLLHVVVQFTFCEKACVTLAGRRSSLHRIDCESFLYRIMSSSKLYSVQSRVITVALKCHKATMSTCPTSQYFQGYIMSIIAVDFRLVSGNRISSWLPLFTIPTRLLEYLAYKVRQGTGSCCC